MLLKWRSKTETQAIHPLDPRRGRFAQLDPQVNSLDFRVVIHIYSYLRLIGQCKEAVHSWTTNLVHLLKHWTLLNFR